MGEVFAGRFELLDPIAEGGMGSVWRVRDLKDRNVYAGKLLRQSDAGSLLRFMREQSTRIDHPHVVTPVSWAGEDDRVLFTMPLVTGGSVATLLGDHGSLPAAWVAVLLDQTLQALEAVHTAGIVHRDLKPANLLLRPTGSDTPHLLLTDFGIAAPVDEPRMTRASQVIGSPGYMAPEQLQGADPEPSHDVYAAGVVGLEMITGARPPECFTVASALQNDPARRPLVDLLLRATSESQELRPAGAAAFREELAGLGVPAPEADPDGPFVFDQFAPEQHSLPMAASPVVREDGAGPNRNRAVAYALLLVALACVVGATLILFS